MPPLEDVLVAVDVFAVGLSFGVGVLFDGHRREVFDSVIPCYNARRVGAACGKAEPNGGGLGEDEIVGTIAAPASTLSGKPKSRKRWHVSRICGAQSPKAPLPYSNQLRQFPGCKRGLNSWGGQPTCQRSQFTESG